MHASNKDLFTVILYNRFSMNEGNNPFIFVYFLRSAQNKRNTSPFLGILHEKGDGDMAKSKNANLHNAKAAKNDEFYTLLSDVSAELKHYRQHFKGKVVFCNCDDPTYSAFWKYFHLNFEFLGLKKLISTHYDPERPTYKMEYCGGDDNNTEMGVKTPLEGNGDFRNQECIDILDEADIVCTNCPFSLFREYLAQLIEHDKKFLIIGNKNAITYKEVFPLLKDNKIWLGYESPSEFNTPIGLTKKVQGLCRWFTNLDIAKRAEKIILWKKYTTEEYPQYDNYDAINVNRTSEIPADYSEKMGVPISFLDKYNPEQFEIVGAMTTTKVEGDNYGYPYINGKKKYARIIVKQKTKEKTEW